MQATSAFFCFIFISIKGLSADGQNSGQENNTLSNSISTDQTYNDDTSVKHTSATNLGTDEDATSNTNFDKAIYICDVEKQKIKEEEQLPYDITLTTKEQKTPILELTDGQNDQSVKEYFDAKYSSGKVQITVNTDVPEEKLTQSQLIFILKASCDDTNNHTVLIANLKDGDPVIKFEQEIYNMRVFEGQVGTVGQVSAIVKNKEHYTVVYKADEELPKWLTLDTHKGTLSIEGNSFPPAATYRFSITSMIEGENCNDTTTVHLTVSSSVICNDSVVFFSYVRITKHVPENELATILPAGRQVSDCIYSMKSQIPKHAELFTLDSNNGELKTATPLVRDSLMKENIPLDIELELSVTCKSDDTQRAQNVNDNANDETTKYNPSVMKLNVVIDGPPIVDNNIVIGYPKNYGFVTHVGSLEYHTVKVLSGSHRYTYAIRENDWCPFYVHPENGNLYPWRHNSSSYDVICSIIITDTDIKEGKNTTVANLTIKPLSMEQMVNVVIVDVIPENVTEVFKNMTEECQVKILTKNVVPCEPDKETKLCSSHKMQIIVYGFDSKQNVLDGNDILKYLEKIPNVKQMYALGPHGHFKDTGFRFFVVMFGVIAFVTIVSLIIIYILYIRNPGQWEKKFSKSSKGVTPLKDDIEPISHTHWISSQTIQDFKNDNCKKFYSSGPALEMNGGPPPGTVIEDGGSVVVDCQKCEYISRPSAHFGGTTTFKPELTAPQYEYPTLNNNQTEQNRSDALPRPTTGDYITFNDDTQPNQSSLDNQPATLPVLVLPPIQPKKQ